MAKRSPKKRKARSENVRIQVEEPNATGNPVVVSFPGGLPESMKNGVADNEAPHFAWQKLREKSKFGRKIVGKDKHCVYSASSQGMLYDDRRTKLCIGVYDKKRGVLVLREAASRGTVFSLAQAVPSYLDNNNLARSRSTADVLAYGKNVFEDFGSSKKRKVLKSQAANKVEIQHVVGAGEGSAVVDQVTKGESMSASNKQAVEASKQGDVDRNHAENSAFEAVRRNFLPPYNELAVKPDKVFNAKEIAGESAWSRVYNKVHACMHQNDVTTAIEGCLGRNTEKDWNPCAIKLIQEISPDSSNAGHRYACTILLNYLIKFYNSSHRRRSLPAVSGKTTSHNGVPNEVASRWLELFATEVPNDQGNISYAMSKANKDKCIVHALLLYMIAQGPTMKIRNIGLIADDMKVPVADCGNMLRLAGCTINKKGSMLSGVLKTPLTFPPPKRGVPRGR